MPCSTSSARAPSASRFDTAARAAPPKITRLESWPVAPKGARSIMPSAYALERADGGAQALGQLGRGLAGAWVQRPAEGDGRARPPIQPAALGHGERAAADVDGDDRHARGQR